MASLDFDKEKSAFKDFYRNNYDLLLHAETAFRVLIRSLLAAEGQIGHTQVTSRLKDCDECIAKFGRKYQQSLEENSTEYEINKYITDLIGLRVTCFYEPALDQIVKTLHSNFKVVGVTDKRALMEAEKDTFGYKGVHLDLTLNEKRRNLPEYHNIVQFNFEVQVRTIIQHAWSEIDHAISYKKSIPRELDRRIRALAALFELADREFLAIRTQSDELRSEAKTRTPEEPSKKAEAHLLDAFIAMEIFTRLFPGYGFMPAYVDGFISDIINLKPSITDQEFLTIFDKNLPVVLKYAQFVETERLRRMNPFTKMRHALYASNRQTFEPMLFPVQRYPFDEWLSKHRSSPKK